MHVYFYIYAKKSNRRKDGWKHTSIEADIPLGAHQRRNLEKAEKNARERRRERKLSVARS